MITLGMLRDSQRAFVEGFIRQPPGKSLLVAAPGTGKSASAAVAAQQLIEHGQVDSVMFLSESVALKEQWLHVAAESGIGVGDSRVDGYGMSTTMQALRRRSQPLTEVDGRRRWLIVADDMSATPSASKLIDELVSLNPANRALFVTSSVPHGQLTFATEFALNRESFIDRPIIDLPSTEIQVARFSPSFSLLKELQGSSSVDGLTWRQFERLIADLLERDGYTVELTQGSKDGGVDVIAVKDLGPGGWYKAVWQAKKLRATSKVGVEVVRELADTRAQFGASKGIIVTSSYLTSGAIQRIERDKYILGKVDRDDLNAWIDGRVQPR